MTPSFIDIEYVPSLYDTTSLVPAETMFGGGKGKWGMILGAVAAIAVPFLAAPIAGALFGGASVIGSAIVGAGLGAVAGGAGAALTGGNIMQGALFGAAGGGIGSGIGAAAGGAGWLAGGAGAAGAVPGAVGTGLNVGAGLSAGTAGTAATTAATAAGGAAAGTVTVGGQATLMSKLTQSLLGQAPQMIGQVVASMSAPDSAQYLSQLEQEMETMRDQDAAGYAARKAIFDQVYNEARNRDPRFEQMMAEAKVKRNSAQQYAQRMDALGMTDQSDASKTAEARKFSVTQPLEQFAAGAQAYGQGEAARRAGLQTAAGLYPETPRGAAASSYGMYKIAQEESDRIAGGASQMAAGLLAPFGSNYNGPGASGVRSSGAGLYYNMG